MTTINDKKTLTLEMEYNSDAIYLRRDTKTLSANIRWDGSAWTVQDLEKTMRCLVRIRDDMAENKTRDGRAFYNGALAWMRAIDKASQQVTA